MSKKLSGVKKMELGIGNLEFGKIHMAKNIFCTSGDAGTGIKI